MIRGGASFIGMSVRESRLQGRVPRRRGLLLYALAERRLAYSRAAPFIAANLRRLAQ